MEQQSGGVSSPLRGGVRATFSDPSSAASVNADYDAASLRSVLGNRRENNKNSFVPSSGMGNSLKYAIVDPHTGFAVPEHVRFVANQSDMDATARTMYDLSDSSLLSFRSPKLRQIINKLTKEQIFAIVTALSMLASVAPSIYPRIASTVSKSWLPTSTSRLTTFDDESVRAFFPLLHTQCPRRLDKDDVMRKDDLQSQSSLSNFSSLVSHLETFFRQQNADIRKSDIFRNTGDANMDGVCFYATPSNNPISGNIDGAFDSAKTTTDDTSTDSTHGNAMSFGDWVQYRERVTQTSTTKHPNPPDKYDQSDSNLHLPFLEAGFQRSVYRIGNQFSVFDAGAHSFQLYVNKTGAHLPSHTVIRIPAPLVKLVIHGGKKDAEFGIASPTDACPDDPTCSKGIGVDCCQNSVGLAFPAPPRFSFTTPTLKQGPNEDARALTEHSELSRVAVLFNAFDIQQECSHPKSVCYPCKKGLLPIVSGHITIQDLLFTVFVCSNPNPEVGSEDVRLGENVAQDNCPSGFVGDKCEHEVGTCLSALSTVKCHCDGQDDVDCPICSNAIGPACGDVNIRRNVRKMSRCGPHATHSVIQYHGGMCACQCCITLPNGRVLCGDARASTEM